MSAVEPGGAACYRAAEVARMLGCSEWWVKEQARHRRIPYAWIGGSYRFTAEHVAAIIRLFEVRPVQAATSVSSPEPVRSKATPAAPRGATRLVARVPRRTRATGEAV